MTTNFTIRDFFVYLLTGALFITAIGLVVFKDFKNYTQLYEIYKVIKNNSLVSAIFIVPSIYLIGHFIGSISYFGHIITKLSEQLNGKFKRLLLLSKLISLFFNKSKINYAITKFLKDNKTVNFSDNNSFWIACAKLQIHKTYDGAVYWYHISEFFDTLYYMFLISAIISSFLGKLEFVLIYFVFATISYFRAKQHADSFVKTVNRLLIAHSEVESEKISNMR